MTNTLMVRSLLSRCILTLAKLLLERLAQVPIVMPTCARQPSYIAFENAEILVQAPLLPLLESCMQYYD